MSVCFSSQSLPPHSRPSFCHCLWRSFSPCPLTAIDEPFFLIYYHVFPPAACGFVFYVNWDTHAHAQLFEQARRKRKRKENKRASIGLPFKSGITQEWRTFSLSVCLRVDLILCVLNSFSSLFLFLFCFPFSYYVSGLSFSLSLFRLAFALYVSLFFCALHPYWPLDVDVVVANFPFLVKTSSNACTAG